VAAERWRTLTGVGSEAPVVIPESHVDIFERESFAHLSTIMPDGTPQSTPVWVDHENREYVLVNTARGRRKEKNVRRNPNVGLSVCDPADPYRYVSVRGEAELTEDGAKDHIDTLAQRYFDQEEYPHHGEESGPRVLIKIPTEEIVTSG
jgi:PPOX class probable F420-dependent enzyme